MKTYAQRDFVNPVSFAVKKSSAPTFENDAITWLAVTLSIFGGVWLLSLIYQFATR